MSTYIVTRVNYGERNPVIAVNDYDTAIQLVAVINCYTTKDAEDEVFEVPVLTVDKPIYREARG